MVHDIICASISERKYPTLYKHAFVSPVPKVHPPEDIETDFRQISVLPVLGKVLEKVQIILNKDAFRAKENQHAFSHGRSTVSALVNITQTWFDDSDNITGEKKPSIPYSLISARPSTWSTTRFFYQSLKKERSISPCGSGYRTFSKTEHNKSNSLASYQQHGLAQQVYHKDLLYLLYCSVSS